MFADPIVRHYDNRSFHKMEKSRRVQVPPSLRDRIGVETQVTLVPWPSTEKREAFISALPPVIMKDVYDKLHAMPYSDPVAQALRRLIGGRSVTVPIDVQGRMVIPEHLAEWAGLTQSGQVVLVGAVDRWEIWSAERFKRAEEEDLKDISKAYSYL